MCGFHPLHKTFCALFGQCKGRHICWAAEACQVIGEFGADQIGHADTIAREYDAHSFTIIVEVRDNARKALPDRISGHCVKPPPWGLVYKRRGGWFSPAHKKAPTLASSVGAF